MAELADGIVVGHCDDPNCVGIHIRMQIGTADIMEAIVPLEHVPGIIESLKNSAYAVAALKNEQN